MKEFKTWQQAHKESSRGIDQLTACMASAVRSDEQAHDGTPKGIKTSDPTTESTDLELIRDAHRTTKDLVIYHGSLKGCCILDVESVF